MHAFKDNNLYDYLRKEFPDELIQSGWAPADIDDFDINYSDPFFDHLDEENRKWLADRLGARAGNLLVTPQVVQQVQNLKQTMQQIAALKKQFAQQWKILTEQHLPAAVKQRYHTNPYMWANIDDMNAVIAESTYTSTKLANGKRNRKLKAEQSSRLKYIMCKLEEIKPPDM